MMTPASPDRSRSTVTRHRNLDAAALAYLQQERPVNEELELTYLRAGADPDWERPHLNGVDITDQPELQTPYQRARRDRFEQRVADYRARGLL